MNGCFANPNGTPAVNADGTPSGWVTYNGPLPSPYIGSGLGDFNGLLQVENRPAGVPGFGPYYATVDNSKGTATFPRNNGALLGTEVDGLLSDHAYLLEFFGTVDLILINDNSLDYPPTFTQFGGIKSYFLGQDFCDITNQLNCAAQPPFTYGTMFAFDIVGDPGGVMFGYANNGAGFIDPVLRDIPEPMSIGLLAVSLAGMALVRRRRLVQ